MAERELLEAWEKLAEEIEAIRNLDPPLVDGIADLAREFEKLLYGHFRVVTTWDMGEEK